MGHAGGWQKWSEGHEKRSGPLGVHCRIACTETSKPLMPVRTAPTGPAMGGGLHTGPGGGSRTIRLSVRHSARLPKRCAGPSGRALHDCRHSPARGPAPATQPRAASRATRIHTAESVTQLSLLSRSRRATSELDGAAQLDRTGRLACGQAHEGIRDDACPIHQSTPIRAVLVSSSRAGPSNPGAAWAQVSGSGGLWPAARAAPRHPPPCSEAQRGPAWLAPAAGQLGRSDWSIWRTGATARPRQVDVAVAAAWGREGRTPASLFSVAAHPSDTPPPDPPHDPPPRRWPVVAVPPTVSYPPPTSVVGVVHAASVVAVLVFPTSPPLCRTTRSPRHPCAAPAPSFAAPLTPGSASTLPWLPPHPSPWRRL